MTPDPQEQAAIVVASTLTASLDEAPARRVLALLAKQAPRHPLIAVIAGRMALQLGEPIHDQLVPAGDRSREATRDRAARAEARQPTRVDIGLITDATAAGDGDG